MATLTANVHLGVIHDMRPDYEGSYTVTPSETAQTLETSGKCMTDDVTINAVPWVRPSGSKNITSNGSHDVEAYETAIVAVPGPTGTKTITQNGTHNVEAYATADVQVPQGVFPSGKITFTQNATGIDVTNYASADVNVNTDPEKGVVLDEWDTDGYPTRARLIGYTQIPNQLLNGNYSTLHRINTIIINQGATLIGASFAITQTSLTSVTFPTTLETIWGYAFDGCSALTTVHIPNTNTLTTDSYTFRATGISHFEVDGSFKLANYTMLSNLVQFICHGQILQWGTGGITSNAVELYDFSGCDTVFALSATSLLPHATGCVIKVKQSLLTDWQNATNWNALTDVVWEGV